MDDTRRPLQSTASRPTGESPRAPDWERIHFDVPCIRCRTNLRGRSEPLCPSCGLRFDWKRVLPVDDLRCRKCTYQLHGLTEQRCPECGTPFRWPEALAAARVRRIRLFEFLWFSNPVPGFLRSLWLAAFRPRKLWAQYDHQIPPRVGPLLLFGLVQGLMFTWGWHVAAWIIDPIMNGISAWIDARSLAFDPTTNEVVATGRPLGFIYRFRVGPLFLPSMALWYLTTFASLQLLFQTKRRLAIRWSDTLRVYVHATAFAALSTAGWCLLEALVDATLFFRPPWANQLTPVYVWLGQAVFVCGLVVTWAHLWIGLARHLKVPRGWLVAAVCLLIGFLVGAPFGI